MGGAGLEQPRSPHLLKGTVVTSFWPQPYNCASLLSVQPPLEECPRGGGTGNSHLGGSRVWPTVEEGLGLQLLPVLAIVLQLQGWGEAGPQAESPPPELFFLGRVFSVLEATTGCGERMMGLSLVPLHRPNFPRPRPVFSPQLWGLF